MRNQDYYQTDYFYTEFHVVFQWGEDILLHEQEYSSDFNNIDKEDLEISEQSTGEFPSDSQAYYNESGEPVALEDIKEMYVVIRWEGENEDRLHEEKVILTSSTP